MQRQGKFQLSYNGANLKNNITKQTIKIYIYIFDYDTYDMLRKHFLLFYKHT